LESPVPHPDSTAAQDRETALYEALLYISEFPNRWPDGDPQAISLAELAREALDDYEKASRV
jgi:hypothetical protein